MNADATGTRWSFPSGPFDDPARALADLASTPALVDELLALVDRINTDDWVDAWLTARRELLNLRRRLEAIHARLVT